MSTIFDLDLVLQASILLVLLIANIMYNVFYLRKNSHHNETNFGKSKIMKCFIVLAFILPYCLMISVPLDVHISNSSWESADTNLTDPWVVRLLRMIWMVVIMLVICVVWLIIPMLIVFYESDETKPFVSQSFFFTKCCS